MLMDPTCLILFNSFSPTALAIRSLHVFANIGSGAVPGRLPGASSGKVPGQVPNDRFRSRFRTTFRTTVSRKFRGGSASRVPGSFRGRF